jgi:hypothetical protein
LLALASVLSLLALVLAAIGGEAVAGIRHTILVLLLAMAAGGVTLVTAMSAMPHYRRGKGEHSTDEAAELRKSLLVADTIIKAEPQVLVLWEPGHSVRVMMHTLTGIP